MIYTTQRGVPQNKGVADGPTGALSENGRPGGGMALLRSRLAHLQVQRFPSFLFLKIGKHILSH